MQNAALNGSTYEGFEHSEDAERALESDLKGPVYLYSFGNAVSHHSTVLYFDGSSKLTVKFDIIGYADSKTLCLRCMTDTVWDPKTETTYYCGGTYLTATMYAINNIQKWCPFVISLVTQSRSVRILENITISIIAANNGLQA
jgi:hypothetical protein